MRIRRLPARLGTVRAKFQVLVGVAVIAAVVVGMVAMNALSSARAASREAVKISSVQRYHQDADRVLEAMQGEVLSAFLIGEGIALRDGTNIEAMLRDLADQFEHDHDEIASLGPSRALMALLPEVDEEQAEFLAATQDLARRALVEPDLAEQALPGYMSAADKLFAEMDQITEVLAQQGQASGARADRAENDARNLIVSAVIVALVALLVLSQLLVRSIESRLRRVADVARRMAAGDLQARNDVRADDEIGALAESFNDLADSFENLVARMSEEADNDSFRRRLNEALEMADTEEDVAEVVGDAMRLIDAHRPMELLQADSSQHHVQTTVVSPSAGAAGCGVESTGSCIAVRRGHTMIFDTSEAINACPKLKDRAGGPCSAVCVPVTFNGRAVGVLHTTGPDRQAPTDRMVEQMTGLATTAGARIGTITAFQGIRRRAATDGLTGLANRQSFEDAAQTCLAHGESFAVVMADLDHFKQLNDTYGHEIGDRALRNFAAVLRDSVRDGDLAARLGGEEFVVLAPRSTAEALVDLVERLRLALTERIGVAELPSFTSSYGISDSTMGRTIEDILRVADAGLLKAKEEGRDRAVVASPELEIEQFVGGRPRGETVLMDTLPPERHLDRV